MPLKFVRNDITRMDTDAIVNTAGEVPVVGAGCDTAVHDAPDMRCRPVIRPTSFSLILSRMESMT